MMVKLSLSRNATLRRNGRYLPVDGVVLVLDANSHEAGGHGQNHRHGASRALLADHCTSTLALD
jgi:hypothetical protein